MRPRLVEQRRGLERTLTGADDEHPAPAEAGQIAEVGRVHHPPRLEAGERWRPSRERRRTSGDDDATRPQALAVVKLEREPSDFRGDGDDTPPIDVLDLVLLEPRGVTEEGRQRHRVGNRHSLIVRPAPDRAPGGRVSDRRRPRRRAKEHAVRHVAAPELHRLTDHPRVDAGRSQMRGGRQTVRAGANDHDLDHSATVATASRSAQGPQPACVPSDPC